MGLKSAIVILEKSMALLLERQLYMIECLKEMIDESKILAIMRYS